MLTVHSNNFHKILEAKRNELLFGTSDRDEIRIEKAADEFDRLQQHLNHEVAIRNLDRESRLLRSVEEALERIKNGTFGLCLRCDEEIPKNRLNAVPWASHCIHCQEELDRRRAAGKPVDGNDSLQSAA
jgi:DnaK suppressor protein